MAAAVAAACQPSPQPTPPPAPSPPPARVEVEEPTTTGESATPDQPPPERPPNTIYRSEIERALRGGPAYLLRQLGPEPYRRAGQFVGWEITRLFPDDPELCAPGCDIEVGDVILSVAGDRLETPQALSRLIERLSSMDTLEVHSLRDGKRRVVTYQLQD